AGCRFVTISSESSCIGRGAAAVLKAYEAYRHKPSGGSRMKTAHLPHPKVPLSRAVAAHGMLYLSGDASIDHETGVTVPGDIRQQTAQTLSNLKKTLEALGSSLDKVVKTTVFMTD